MKNLTAIQKQRVEVYKKSANKESRWYSSDLHNFIEGVMGETPAQSKERLDRMNYMQSKEFEKETKKLQDELFKGGMYDLDKMKPNNALD